MNKRTRISGIAIAAAISLISLQANAQNGSNSPYSRYGFGTINDRAQGFNKGMAGVAQGFRDATAVNFQNPASYSAVDSLTLLFDIGVSLQNANFKQGSLKTNAKNTSVDYITAQFRAWRNVGMSFGLLPLTSIGYSFKNKQTRKRRENRIDILLRRRQIKRSVSRCRLEHSERFLDRC